jgi:hypothetical protein
MDLHAGTVWSMLAAFLGIPVQDFSRSFRPGNGIPHAIAHSLFICVGRSEQRILFENIFADDLEIAKMICFSQNL